MEGKEEGWREEKDKKIRRKWTRLEQQCLFHPSFTCTSLTTGSTLSNLLARLFARFFITRPAAPSSNTPLLPLSIPRPSHLFWTPCFFYTGTQEGRKFLHATYLFPLSLLSAILLVSFSHDTRAFFFLFFFFLFSFFGHLFLQIFSSSFLFLLPFPRPRPHLLLVPLWLLSRGHGSVEFEPGFDLAAPELSRSA